MGRVVAGVLGVAGFFVRGLCADLKAWSSGDSPRNDFDIAQASRLVTVDRTGSPAKAGGVGTANVSGFHADRDGSTFFR